MSHTPFDVLKGHKDLNKFIEAHVIPPSKQSKGYKTLAVFRAAGVFILKNKCH